MKMIKTYRRDESGTPPSTSGFTGTVVNLFCRVVDIPLGSFTL